MADRGETSNDGPSTDHDGDLGPATQTQRPRLTRHMSSGSKDGNTSGPGSGRPQPARAKPAVRPHPHQIFKRLPPEVYMPILKEAVERPGADLIIDQDFLPAVRDWAQQALAGEEGEEYLLRGRTVVLPTYLGPHLPEGEGLLDASTVPLACREQVTAVRFVDIEFETARRGQVATTTRDHLPAKSPSERAAGADVEVRCPPAFDIRQIGMFSSIRHVYVDALNPGRNTASAWFLNGVCGRLRLSAMASDLTLVVRLSDWIFAHRPVELQYPGDYWDRVDKYWSPRRGEDITVSLEGHEDVMGMFREALDVGKDAKLKIVVPSSWLGPKVIRYWRPPPGGQGLGSVAARADTLARAWLRAVGRRCGITYHLDGEIMMPVGEPGLDE